MYQTYLAQRKELIGKSILNNSEIKTFFSLEEENIKILEKYTSLSEKEKVEIKSLKRGECLMFIGNEHILTKIESADFEKIVVNKRKPQQVKKLSFEKTTSIK